MCEKSIYEGINNVVEIKSSGSEFDECKVCGKKIKFLADAANHYISEHGYRFLHISTYTDLGEDNKPWNFTVALLGK